jgi:hypothetical protein
MKTIKHIVEGDLIVSEEICLTGIVTGGITVTATGQLELHGVCCKHFVIEKGGRAKIYGVVSGNLSNLGGELSIFGIVSGRIFSGRSQAENCGVVMAG